MHARFSDRLQREFQQRRAKNRRYSLRAFAAALGTDHSTLSQVLRNRRRVSVIRIRAWAKRLQIDPEETAAYVIAEQLIDDQALRRDTELRHWSAEAAAVLAGRTHWEIVRWSRTPEFRPDCRWIAERTGATTDEVNVALARLLRLGLLEIRGKDAWCACPAENEKEFRRLALARVRQRKSDAQSRTAIPNHL